MSHEGWKQEQEEKRRESSSEQRSSRTSSAKQGRLAGKKRRIAKGGKRVAKARAGKRAAAGPEPEAPLITGQPSLDSYEEGGPETSNRPEQEPPPPTAYVPDPGIPGGDADDLFEYVF